MRYLLWERGEGEVGEGEVGEGEVREGEVGEGEGEGRNEDRRGTEGWDRRRVAEKRERRGREGGGRNGEESGELIHLVKVFPPKKRSLIFQPFKKLVCMCTLRERN